MRGKKGIWLLKKGLERPIHVCAKEPNDQAVCVDVRLLGTTEVIYQNSAILVLLHEYGPFLGACIMGILYYGTKIVIYVMSGYVRV
jgi:hypothetical protein